MRVSFLSRIPCPEDGLQRGSNPSTEMKSRFTFLFESQAFDPILYCPSQGAAEIIGSAILSRVTSVSMDLRKPFESATKSVVDQTKSYLRFPPPQKPTLSATPGFRFTHGNHDRP
jgi:hypothetical protein